MRFYVLLKGSNGYIAGYGVDAEDEWEARQAALKAHAANPEGQPSWCDKVEQC